MGVSTPANRLAAVTAIPLKPEYGPTLGRLLSPRWRAASPVARGAVIAAAAGLLALVLAAGLTLENPTFSHGGRVPFGFSYRDLYRVAPDPGGYVKVQRHLNDGRLEDSFAVESLVLPPYSGGISGELPLYAVGYIRGLSERYAGFVLRGEGKTRVNTVPAYNIFYTATVKGQTMFGRDVLLLPERSGVREGVDIVMLTSPTASSRVTSPSEVASMGVLHATLGTFTFG
jgi:hypothetical protein